MVQCAGCSEEAAYAFVNHTFQEYGDLLEATAYLMLGVKLSWHKVYILQPVTIARELCREC
jgi:hypothetical protein